MRVALALGRHGLRGAAAEHFPPCPLRQADLLGTSARLTVIDNAARCCWQSGRAAAFPCAAGIEAALEWQGLLLTLSGETDCLTLHDGRTGDPLFLAPCGVYPRDMCLVGGNTVAVACGAEGTVRIFRLPELTLKSVLRVAGNACLLAAWGSRLFAASAAGEEELHCELTSFSLNTGHARPLLSLPGLPGAMLAAPDGTLWLGVTEALAHVEPEAPRLCGMQRGFGLPRRLQWTAEGLLVTDPVLEQVLLLDPRGWEKPRVLYQGAVEDARGLP